MLEIEVLHAAHGDKRKRIDTSDEKGRQEAAIFINRQIKAGTAIFLERGKKTFRVKKYDPKNDCLLVAAEVRGQEREVRAKSRKGRKTAVAPVAGG